MKNNFFLNTAGISILFAIGAALQYWTATYRENNLTLSGSFLFAAAFWALVALLTRKFRAPKFLTAKGVAAQYTEIRYGIYQAIKDSIDLEYGKYGDKHSPMSTFYSTVNMRRRSLPPLAAKAYEKRIFSVLDSPTFKAIDKAWMVRH